LIDGILLHQLLQAHMMLSAAVPPVTVEAIRLNVRWDGAFEALCWAFATAGSFMLYRAALYRMPVPPPRVFTGSLLLGWGGFNFVEGLIDHEILGLHHMHEGSGHIVADLLFLAIGGVLLIGIGALLVRPRRDWIARGDLRKRITPVR
jgi:uncharacterized membrane protein